MIEYLSKGWCVTGEQFRAGRILVGWTAAELGEKAGVSYPTVQRIDATRGAVSGRHSTIEALRKALEGAGVEFLEEGDAASGPGVAMKKGPA